MDLNVDAVAQFDGKLDNTLQGRWREAPISDHFDHFLHEYIGVLFCIFFAKKVKKVDFLLQKGGPKRGPIQMDSYSQISICEGFFSVIWPCPRRLYPSQKSRFSRTRFSIFTEADMTA